ncbi:protein EFR3 homolog A isoform X2 [Anolis carolinensis]|uniref:protein EFR3 homolog A isoform X2 n=1 Tax=Anolis carolinensis TaxID=28377 RepID=UPI0007DB75CB|nr:PREDICTED: protein EFR3 homolog A [Anolis carolinensis]|eukprot:XP_008121615.2 PREDICTED: protein EFR3 homolog A [Anolis carolinensis]
MPGRVCCCCAALRPRYKRLVDNIFPEDPKDGLVKADMEKLTFYAVSAPEKLDRIGAYLAERLSRDVVRHRYGYVFIAMEALDQLLMACHSQSIKPFVESFLHMVAKLLESGEPKLQVLGTNSFVKFANIEEDTPSYHRRYDFFVSRFSAMCHSCHSDPEIRNEIRIAGIRGIQGVVRKTVNDELRATIWEPQHMDKIVPSLLFNMQKIEDADSRNGPPASPTGGDKEEDPAYLAENCFRELLGRATYGNMNHAVRPVFAHLGHHKLWDPNEFAVHCFKIIMYSIQAQYSHHVIQEILRHLDTCKRASPRVRAGIIQVLLEAVAIAAKGSIGPTVLEVFNTLLKHLSLSVDFELGSRRGSEGSTVDLSAHSKENDEKIVQNAIIQTIGFFGSNLPDYQRSEIMMFIMGKVPVFGTVSQTLDTSQLGEQGTRRIQIMLLRSLLMVTSGYNAKSMATVLSAPFLDPLLSSSLTEDCELRQLVLEILHNLIDRHDNRAKLRGIRIIPDVSDLKIKRDKISRQDVSFMKKHGQQLYRHIYLGCKEEDNVHKNFELLYTSLALITIELANEEVVIDLIRVAIALQDTAILNEDNLPMFSRCSIMALVAAYLNFLSQMIAVPAFCQHISKVIETRTIEAPYFLPETVFRDKYSLPKTLDKDDKTLFFLTHKIAESLGGSGYSVERLSVPYVPQVTDEDRLSRRKSIVDTVSIQVDILPGTEDKVNNTEEITFEALKKAIDNTGLEEQEKEKRRQVIEKFQKAPFEEIAAQCETKANLLHDRLAQILELTIRPPPSPSGTLTITAGHPHYQSVPVYEMKFPDLCVY